MRGCGLEVEASAERPNAEYTWYKLNEWMQVEVLQEFGAFMEEQPWFRFPFFAHLRGACRPPRRPCSRISYSPLLGCLAAWLLGCSRPPSLPPSRPRELLPTPSPHPSNPRPHAALDGGSLLRGAAAGVLHRQAETGRAQSGALPRVPHRRGAAS